MSSRFVFNAARRAAAVVLALSLVAPAVRAQAAKPFDPDAELAGFSEMRGWNQAYKLQPFLAKSGKPLAPSERTALIADWGREKVAIEKLHADAEKDPFLARVDHTITSTRGRPSSPP